MWISPPISGIRWSCRLQIGDTAQRGQAATKAAFFFLCALGCWLRLARAALYVSGPVPRPSRKHDWERGLRLVELVSCKQNLYLKTSFPKALWTSLAP